MKRILVCMGLFAVLGMAIQPAIAQSTSANDSIIWGDGSKPSFAQRKPVPINVRLQITLPGLPITASLRSIIWGNGTNQTTSLSSIIWGENSDSIIWGG